MEALTPTAIETAEQQRDEAERKALLEKYVEPLVPAALAADESLEHKQAEVGDDYTQWEHVTFEWLRERGVSEITSENFRREREALRLCLWVRPQELRKFAAQARNLRLADKRAHSIKPKPGEPGPISEIAKWLINELRRLPSPDDADTRIRLYTYWLDRVRRYIRNPADIPVTPVVEKTPDTSPLKTVTQFSAWTGKPLDQ